MINRLILWLALAGMILAIHLWIQKARDFDQGCLGISKPVFVTDVGCRDDGLQAASHLFGVSNAAWGYMFYFAVALAAFAKIVTPRDWARRLHLFSEIAVALALMYSIYLVGFMVFVAGAICVLCLTSAVLVGALALLHVRLRVGGGFQPIADAARGKELGIASGSLFAAMGVLVGVLLFINRIGTRPLNQGGTAQEIERMVGQSLPHFVDAEHLREVRACVFDLDSPPLDLKKFIRPDTPFLGRAEGIPVVIFYDPNCPHCAAFHPAFLRLTEKFKDQARFYILPRVLWDLSRQQVEALKLAEQSGKYFELWQKQFARQTPEQSGMTVAQIATQFQESGLDSSNLERRMSDIRAAVETMQRRVVVAGVRGVPAIFVDGQRVNTVNQSEACLGKLIEQRVALKRSGSPAP